MASPLKPLKELRPPAPRKWDDGISWQMLMLEGELPAIPKQARGARPLDVWPRVEGRLGYGIGNRLCRFLIAKGSPKVDRWTWPSWWDVEQVDSYLQTFCQETGKPLDLIPRQRKANETKSPGLPLRTHWSYAVTVRIDGVTPGPTEAVEFYRVALGQ